MVGKNYISEVFFSDLQNLKVLLKEADAENFVLSHEFLSKLFLSYNKVFNYYFYKRARNFLLDQELDFESFDSLASKYKARSPKQLSLFLDQAIDSFDAYDLISEIWERFGVDREQCNFCETVESFCSDLYEKIEVLEKKEKFSGQEELDIYCLGFNVKMRYFLEFVSLRYNLVSVFINLKNFS